GIEAFQVEPAPGPVEGTLQLSPGKVGECAPGRVDHAKVAPLSPQGRQVMLARDTWEILQYAQALMGHQAAGKDAPAVLERALKLLVAELEKTKFAKTSRPRPGVCPGASPRHIPAAVKRQVWERDHGHCTFTSDQGRRCSERSRLEFDHVDPVARGGQASVDNIRLRCRAHNQYEAERVFEVPFMNHKRAEARQAAAARRAKTEVKEIDPERDVIPWLRGMG